MIEMYWAKIFTTKTEIVAALCDEELLDKKLEFRKKDVEVKISKYFYGERLLDEESAVRLLDEATIGNLIGKSVVKLAKEKGFITKENIINIDGVPHAQFVKL